MRIEKQILLKVLKQLEYTYTNRPGRLTGLCQEVYRTKLHREILPGEEYSFSVWFLSQKPSKTMNKQFYIPELEGESLYWWPRGHYQVRRDFLEHLIKKRIR